MSIVTVGNRGTTTVKRSPTAASQSEVDEGIKEDEYVSPKTLNDWNGAGGSSAASQDQVDAGTATGVYVSPSTLSNKDADAATLTDGATIALTGEKHTLATSRSAITFTNSFTGDGIFLEIVLSATSSTLTFPAGYLCQVGGTASGDNTASLSGTSGDKYVVSIIKVGSQYYVGVTNMGQ